MHTRCFIIAPAVLVRCCAAYEVGYESVSQFNREYARLFGQPPMRDVKAIRDGKVSTDNAA